MKMSDNPQTFQKIYSEIGRENIIDYRKFPNVEHLKNDSYYKKLIKEKKELQKSIDNYLLKHKE